jgi:hypothetical protein
MLGRRERGGGGRGLGSRKIRLRRLYCELEEVDVGEVRDVQKLQVGCFQLINTFLQLEIFLR